MTAADADDAAFGAPAGEAEAAGLMLPRLAALGPAMHLSAIGETLRYHHAESEEFRLTWSRLGRMVVAVFVGLLVLLAPMTVLAYSVNQLAQVTNSTQHQHVPGGVVHTPLHDPVLTPAYTNTGQP